MVRTKRGAKDLLPHVDLSRIGEREQISDSVMMAVEFMKHQGEVAYEISKRQAIALTSTASTIGIGWSAFFFGVVQESWFTSSLGLMMVFAGTYILGFWTPKVLDRVRDGLDAAEAARVYSALLASSAKSGDVGKSQ